MHQSLVLRACRKCRPDCRRTADSSDGVPLGGLAKLGSDVAQQMTDLGTFDALPQRPLHDIGHAINSMTATAASQMNASNFQSRNSFEPLKPMTSALPGATAPGDVRLLISEQLRRKGAMTDSQTERSLHPLHDTTHSEGSGSSVPLLLSAGPSNDIAAQDRWVLADDADNEGQFGTALFFLVALNHLLMLQGSCD